MVANAGGASSIGARIIRSVYGDAAVMMTVSAPELDARRATAQALRSMVLDARIPGVRDVVAGLESLLVQYDCLRIDSAALDEQLALLADRAISTPGSTASSRTFVVPTVFGGEFGPDLDAVAEELNLSRDRLVDAFTATVQTVDILGSGTAPMMHGIDFGRSIGRSATPRHHVPAGAVMVAGCNSIIGPAPGPSGWRILGRTPLLLFDIHRDPVVHYAPGDRFRFEPLPARRWTEFEGRPLLPEGQS
jgi:KipI family sensor histidine kinase inhibitor